MMTPPGIGAPDTVLLYGGSAELFAEHEQALRVLGGRTTHLSLDVGIPSLYDVALLGIMWGTFNSFMHPLALVGTENIAATEFLPFATGWLGGVTSFMSTYARQIDKGEYRAGDATLETQLPPIGHLVENSFLFLDTYTLPFWTEPYSGPQSGRLRARQGAWGNPQGREVGSADVRLRLARSGCAGLCRG
ncbi:hypothetical protein ACFLIM_45515 [Nonomuraea sp. M3C6]|uniref:NADPH-dependent reductive aminase-like C-terminal domain-containing protein n=1 Tax=Nonomuraea marmarensis TaxID=3351344 RepID=A0ABW7ASQ0_9ACTN